MFTTAANIIRRTQPDVRNFIQHIYMINTVVLLSAKKWLDKDVDLDWVKDQTFSVIGYGIQGLAQAKNMKDSGLDVLVGLRNNGNSWKSAQDDGHNVVTISEATKRADVIHILIPDMEQAEIYRKEIAPFLEKGKAFSFSHGAAIHWNWISPPKDSRHCDGCSKGSWTVGQRTIPAIFWHAIPSGSLSGLYGKGMGEGLGDGQGNRKVQDQV